MIKQLEQDLVTAVQKVKTQKEEHTKKLVGFRNEVRGCCSFLDVDIFLVCG